MTAMQNNSAGPQVVAALSARFSWGLSSAWGLLVRSAPEPWRLTRAATPQPRSPAITAKLSHASPYASTT
jgi:hypothetical protein